MLPTLGALPSGTRLERILQSPNYRNGEFQNLSPTEVMLPGTPWWKVMATVFNKPKTTVPPVPLPVVLTNLQQLDDREPVIVWFGHSSYLISHRGFRILVDPVFSGHASPVPIFGKAFAGTDAYRPDDFGRIDLLLLTHDHYDHLDYATVRRMHPQVGHICASLGVGAHLERWGISPAKITELDWWERYEASAEIRLTCTPARHFSGRGLKRAQSLWSAFVLELPGYRLFLGGDSGYDEHFKKIGQEFGPFDLALLECGQYGNYWPLIHTTPEETVRTAIDLQAKVLFPVHWAKFALAAHAWDEPIKRVLATASGLGMPLATPMIGEPMTISAAPATSRWWETV